MTQQQCRKAMPFRRTPLSYLSRLPLDWLVGQFESGTGVPPVKHAQDARATTKLTHYPRLDGNGGAAS